MKKRKSRALPPEEKRRRYLLRLGCVMCNKRPLKAGQAVPSNAGGGYFCRSCDRDDIKPVLFICSRDDINTNQGFVIVGTGEKA